MSISPEKNSTAVTVRGSINIIKATSLYLLFTHVEFDLWRKNASEFPPHFLYLFQPIVSKLINNL